MGDLFAPTPDPDFSAGGSLVGWGPVLEQVLSRATELVRTGVPKDQLMAQLKTNDLGWRLSFSLDPLDRFYTELSQAK